MVPATPPCGLWPEPFMTKPAIHQFRTPAIDKLPEDIRTRIFAMRPNDEFYMMGRLPKQG
jgi:hypothetical protein